MTTCCTTSFLLVASMIIAQSASSPVMRRWDRVVTPQVSFLQGFLDEFMPKDPANGTIAAAGDASTLAAGTSSNSTSSSSFDSLLSNIMNPTPTPAAEGAGISTAAGTTPTPAADSFARGLFDDILKATSTPAAGTGLIPTPTPASDGGKSFLDGLMASASSYSSDSTTTDAASTTVDFMSSLSSSSPSYFSSSYSAGSSDTVETNASNVTNATDDIEIVLNETQLAELRHQAKLVRVNATRDRRLKYAVHKIEQNDETNPDDVEDVLDKMLTQQEKAEKVVEESKALDLQTDDTSDFAFKVPGRKVEVANIGSGLWAHRGLRTSEEIESGEVVLSLNASQILSSAFGDEELHDHVFDSENDTVRNLFLHNENKSWHQGRLILSLLHELSKGENSSFHQYIRSLPQSFSHVGLDFNDEDLELLRGTPIYAACAASKSKSAHTFERVMQVLADEFPDTFDSEDYTVVKWRWAEMVVTTRAVGYNAGGEKQLALVPLLDIVNHGSGNTSWKFDDNKFMLVTNQRYLPNEEVTIPYGKFDNMVLLKYYGFLLPNNSVRLNLTSSSNASIAKVLDVMNTTLQDLVDKLHVTNTSTVNKMNSLLLKKMIIEQALGVEGEDYDIEYPLQIPNPVQNATERLAALHNASEARENRAPPKSRGMMVVKVPVLQTPTEEVNITANETVEHAADLVPSLMLNGTASAADLLGNSSDANGTAPANVTDSTTSLVAGTDVAATSSLFGTSTSTTDFSSSTSTTTLGGAAPPAIELPSASSYSSLSSSTDLAPPSSTDLSSPPLSTDSSSTSLAVPSLPSLELPGATTSFGGLSPEEASKKRALAARGSTSAHVANAATAATAMSKH